MKILILIHFLRNQFSYSSSSQNSIYIWSGLHLFHPSDGPQSNMKWTTFVSSFRWPTKQHEVDHICFILQMAHKATWSGLHLFHPSDGPQSNMKWTTFVSSFRWSTKAARSGLHWFHPSDGPQSNMKWTTFVSSFRWPTKQHEVDYICFILQMAHKATCSGLHLFHPSDGPQSNMKWTTNVWSLRWPIKQHDSPVSGPPLAECSDRPHLFKLSVHKT